MKHYKAKDPDCVHNDDCFKCHLLSYCSPKAYKRKMEAVDKRWKDKYGDEF